MEEARRAELSPTDYRALGSFRYQIRRFLHFSEEAARHEGLEPQQHQMLLSIRALGESEGPTVSQLAQHLFIRHHSAVGLLDRLERRGLVARERVAQDRRKVTVRLTPAGEEKLGLLTAAHQLEFRRLGPVLVDALGVLLREREEEGMFGEAEERRI